MNSLDQPKAIGPQATTVEVKNGKLTVNLEPHSVSVYRIPY
jgi:alpha-L-arabinofuranosidase